MPPAHEIGDASTTDGLPVALASWSIYLDRVVAMLSRSDAIAAHGRRLALHDRARPRP